MQKWKISLTGADKLKTLYLGLLIIILVSCDNTEKYYYPTGELFSEVQVDNDGKNNGTLKKYYITGEIEGKGNYTNGLKDGTFIEYYKNGNTKSLEVYKNGKIQDTTKRYYENGVIKSIAFEDTNGSYYREFYKNGNKQSEGYYKDSILVDWWNYYSDLGDIIQKREYINKNDEAHLNQLITFNDNKNIVIDSSYYYSFLISKIKNSKYYRFKIDYEPSIKNAEVFLILSDSLNSDFSNLKFVQSDTLYMDNNTLTSNTLKEPYRKLKGYFYEYYSEIIDSTKHKDSIRISIKEKRTFFDKNIKVTDTISR